MPESSTTYPDITPTPETIKIHSNSMYAVILLMWILVPLSIISLVIYYRLSRSGNKTCILNLHLSLINFISAIVLLPMFYTFYMLLGIKKQSVLKLGDDDAYSKGFCGSLALLFYVITSLHFCILLGLSLDRFIAVCFPLSYRNLSSMYYKVSLGIVWMLAVTFPAIGFAFSDPTSSQPLFYYWPSPHIRVKTEERIFCEINFLRWNGVTKIQPTSIQKIYCFIIMGIPFITFPVLIIILSICTMSGIIMFFMSYNRRHNGFSLNKSLKTKASLMLSYLRTVVTCSKIAHSSTSRLNRSGGGDIEGTIETISDNHAEEDLKSSVENVSSHSRKFSMRRKSRMTYHFQAFNTLLILLVIFATCDSIWLITRLDIVAEFIWNYKYYDKINIFTDPVHVLYIYICARFGTFIYSAIIPFVLLWRQPSYRNEFRLILASIADCCIFLYVQAFRRRQNPDNNVINATTSKNLSNNGNFSTENFRIAPNLLVSSTMKFGNTSYHENNLF